MNFKDIKNELTVKEIEKIIKELNPEYWWQTPIFIEDEHSFNNLINNKIEEWNNPGYMIYELICSTNRIDRENFKNLWYFEDGGDSDPYLMNHEDFLNHIEYTIQCHAEFGEGKYLFNMNKVILNHINIKEYIKVMYNHFKFEREYYNELSSLQDMKHILTIVNIPYEEKITHNFTSKVHEFFGYDGTFINNDNYSYEELDNFVESLHPIFKQ